MGFTKKFWLFPLLLFVPGLCFAAGSSGSSNIMQATDTTPAIIALCIFSFAYLLVMSEEFIDLRKSKPMIVASGIIWVIVALVAQSHGNPDLAHNAVKHNILEYAELFLFLLVAMTYVNSMEERLVFDVLRAWLVGLGLTYRQLFWLTGILAFFISPIADNLTTALLMCAVIMSVGRENKKFVGLGCINIVVAANAGGAFSPFGDITTLMVWQKGIVHFWTFFHIFLPSVVSYVIPAGIMYFAIPKQKPAPIEEHPQMLPGARMVIFLFLVTISLAVCFHNYLHLPPVVGMMAGMGLLQFLGFYLKMKHKAMVSAEGHFAGIASFDIFKKVQRAEWDTLLFFYGVILCVGGLATLGYLEVASNYLYHGGVADWGASFGVQHAQTPANFAVGFLSAVVDNIPVMFAVLTMLPDMSQGQWLLVTLTAGIGGSMLSVGSAAGVALMGQARGYYTFFSHIKWTWAIALGYCAGVLCHLWLNADLFQF